MRGCADADQVFLLILFSVMELISLIVFIINMGSKPSIQIQTDTFNPIQWQYQPYDPNVPEDYGLYRCLINKLSGEKIDEYQFIWGSEQDFLYYLKSYNWRSKLENIVNSRFLVQKNHEQICSHTYMATIYIEHMKMRLSQISDIPFPDNLYMLMESLEGYARIYEHSKYFIVEENQVCVDEKGNVKVWVNGDLSINYPAIIVQNSQNLGEYHMVDAIVNMIADNTDEQTQPSPTFRQYFEQQISNRPQMTFDQARTLVFTYARYIQCQHRINNTQIPSRFQAAFHIQSSEHDLQTFTNNSITQPQDHSHPQIINSYHSLNQVQKNNQMIYSINNHQQPKLAQTLYTSNNQPSHILPIPSFYNKSSAQYSFGNEVQSQPVWMNEDFQYPKPVQSQIVRFGSSTNSKIPQYHSIYQKNVSNNASSALHEVPEEPLNRISEERISIDHFKPLGTTLPSLANQQVSYMIPINHQFSGNLPNLVQNNQVSYVSPRNNANVPISQLIPKNPVHQQTYLVNNYCLNDDSHEHVDDDQFFMIQNSEINLQRSNINKKQTTINYQRDQPDDQVAKSLPIRPGNFHPNLQSLSKKFDSNNKSTHSQIQQKKQWSNNLTFGDRQRKNRTNMTLKYYNNLQEELQIDPIIAADLARLIDTRIN